jgi:hypothetical protein
MFYDYWSCCGDYLTGYQLEIQAWRLAPANYAALEKIDATPQSSR